jgi:mono/diheme cytochrome c family protein
MTQVRSFSRFILLAASLMLAGQPVLVSAADLLVLMNASGKVERYDLATGTHVGTVISGLPSSNEILVDADGRLLISTGVPGGVGNVLRFDPRNGGKMETWLDVPEGYGGRLFRATGMAWLDGDLLVASQGDGKVKRFDGKSGEWKADVALASPGGMTQIAVHGGRLFITDFAAQMVRRASEKLDGTMSEPWVQQAAQAPWGLVFDAEGRAYWSTAANRIHRFDGTANVEWAGAGGGLNIPIGLTLGPDGNLYAASLHGQVTVWKTDAPNAGAPLRVIGGPEMKEPISIAFTTLPRGREFVMAPPAAAGVESAEKVAFFESKIRPLLVEHCIECHGEKKQKGGLRLDSRAAWQAGGDTGKAILAGKPEESLLIKAVRYADKDLQMPPKKALPPEEVALLVEWIQQGAVDPRNDAPAAAQPVSDDWAAEFQKRLDWWSLKPMQKAEPPTVADASWNREPVDRFIRSGLDAASLPAAPRAEAEVLLRRLSFVLTGLPPTPEMHTRFLAASQTDADAAYVALVDELLSSAHFGEHFARHWMDVVRYTDTYGYEWDVPAKGSHEYRDYLIRAFNGEVGYDQFLREQIAGDLLAQPRVDAALQINESLIGPMFYHLGEHRHGSSLDANGVHQEMVNNKIDAFSKVFLATTVACARCHNHKLEAVSQRDYYALGAVFMTPRWTSRAVDAPRKNDVAIAKLKELRGSIRKELSARWKSASIIPEGWRKPLEIKDAPAPKLEEIAYPLAKLTKAEGGIEAAWNALAKEWTDNRAARTQANAAFTVLADFSQPSLPAGWTIDGDGMTHGWVPEATPLVALDGDAVLTRLLPRGYHTHALSSKLPGALHMPPQHLVAGNFASLRLAGGEFGGHLMMDENTFLNERVTFLNEVKPAWKTFGDTPLKNGVTRVTLDFTTASLNPNFPPRHGVAPGLPATDTGYDKHSWLSITGIVTHDAGGTPQDMLDAFTTLYTGPAPKTVEEANARITAWLTGAVQRWCEERTQPGDGPVLDWLLANQMLPNKAEAGSPLAALVSEYRRVEQTIAFPRTVNSMDERSTAKAGLHFNVRGNVDSLGEVVMPDFLQMFAGRNDVAKSTGSGRLELAESLLHPEHPLTSRVYVNRVWQWIFGTGLVATPDDFGRLGDKPSHPELLDWLAREFIREAWSTKKLVRRLVLSETFRQSGTVTAAARERDPANRLRHHYPTRRLEAEGIRDALLAVSSRLDATLYGLPINPHRATELPTRYLFSGPLDGDGRRSLYLKMSIMAPPSFLTAFDLPDLKLPSGKRNVTNVPTQSLMMLNDPLVSTLAKHWATQLLKAPHATAEERVSAMFIQAFARAPQPAELQQWTAAARDFATTPEILHDEAAWTQLAHALFNTQEFIHYR